MSRVKIQFSNSQLNLVRDIALGSGVEAVLMIDEDDVSGWIEGNDDLIVKFFYRCGCSKVLLTFIPEQ